MKKDMSARSQPVTAQTSLANAGSEPSAAPEPGMTVYGHDGTRAEFVGMIRDRFVVRPVARFVGYDGEDFEELMDGVEMWNRIYPAAPVAVQDQEIRRLQGEIEDARRALLETQREIAEAQRDHLATLKRLKRYEPLKNLEPLLNGEITHVVEGSGYGHPTIRPFAEAVVYRDNYDRKDSLRMLSLKPEPDGALMWHLNRWSDGSGVDSPTVLCTSEEEAREAALAMIIAPLTADRVESHPHLWAAAVVSAERLGLTLPPEVVEIGVSYRVAQAQVVADKAAEALAQAQAVVTSLANADTSERSSEPREAP